MHFVYTATATHTCTIKIKIKTNAREWEKWTSEIGSEKERKRYDQNTTLHNYNGWTFHFKIKKQQQKKSIKNKISWNCIMNARIQKYYKCHETNAIKMRIIYRHCLWTNTNFSINSDINLSPCMDREQNRIELSLSRWASSINWQFNSIHSMWTLNMVKLTREFRAQIRGALLIDDPFAINRLKSLKTAFPVFLLRITFKE